MKSILLTTTAIVAFAGAAAADGHISIGWSGTATAGVAREGGSDAVVGDPAGVIISLLEALDDADVAATDARIAGIAAVATAIVEELATVYGDALSDDADDDVAFAEDLAAARTNVEKLRSESQAVLGLTNAQAANLNAVLDAHVATGAALFGTTEVETGDFDTYAEVNATVTGSVATDNGLTLSASMSVDAGRGYDFADDDGFDSPRTNGVGFDNVTLDAGAFGTLKFAPDDIAHLVDGDDDGSVDVLYTNDFGIAKFSFALDIDTDFDDEASAQSWELVALDNTVAGFDPLDDAPAGALGDPFDDAYFGTDGTDTYYLTYAAAVDADVQWSAKVEAPVADIATVYAAFDEEGGYDIGATTTVAGLTVKAKVKSEALAVAQEKDAEFDVSGSYTVSGLTVGAGWNSIEDGDQWRISGAYTMGAISVAASTDEGEDWEVTGSYDLGSGASLVGGVNYTEDAYVGVSFKF